MSQSSYGITLGVNAARTGSTYTAIAKIVEGSLPEITQDTFETKTLDQGNRAKGYQGSFYDGGSCAFKIEYAKAQYNTLLTYSKDPVPYPIKITLPEASTVTFDGIFTKLSAPLPADGGRIECDVEIKVTGDVTFTPAA